VSLRVELLCDILDQRTGDGRGSRLSYNL
jgi:hypothetical protein